MSKRYGRNQKRRAREQIEVLQEANGLMRELNAWQGGQLRSKQAEIDRAKALAIPFCALFEPDDTEGYGDPADGQPHHMHELRRMDMDDVTASYLNETVRHVPLDLVYASLDHDRLKDVMHATVRYRDQRACYAISRAAMAQMPRERLMEHLTRDIARQLAARIVNGARGSGRQLR